MKNINFRTWSVPLALLILCIISFGLLIPWLGFYWDDWPVILTTRLQGDPGLWEFFLYNRPVSAWIYIVTTPVLGTSPLPWQIFGLFLRWLTVLGMWWTLRGLWPQRTRAVTYMAILFAIYPVFRQQPISVAYTQHWTTFALFFLSMGGMIQALRKPRWFWPLLLLSLTAAAVELFSMEYFLGLEVLRPVFLWLVLSENQPSMRQRTLNTLKNWLPYLLVVVAYLIWRIFFMQLVGEDPNQPELLFDLTSHPLGSLRILVQTALQDVVFILTAAWYDTLQPTIIDLKDRVLLFSAAVALFTTLGVVFYLLRLKTNDESEDLPAKLASQDHWVWQAMFIGLVGTVMGPLPIWLTGKQTIVGMYSDRFGLASMFGASILLVAVLEWLTPRRLSKVVLVGVLVGLAVGFHIRHTNQFRWIWTKQTRFYWQLHWRAPYIEPQTTVLSDSQLFTYVGYYSISAALNLAYPQPHHSSQMDYWFLDLYRNFRLNMKGLVKGLKIKRDLRHFTYTASSLNSLVINYDPEDGRCLWVLSPSDTDNYELPDITVQALPVSNLSRIKLEAPQAGYPPTNIFGPEPAHTWCYFFEKADLARQMGDWKQVAALGDQARQEGHVANDIQEWMPFIEGYAHVDRWKLAQELTEQVVQAAPKSASRLCHLWDRVQASTTPSPEGQQTIQALHASLACTP